MDLDKVANRIQELDKETVTKLSIGAIITNRLDIITQLIENSIDANSTIIDISISTTRGSITVVDNGIGIRGEDIHLCTKKNHTSKIKDYEDLSKLKDYLGFRGEALYAIKEGSDFLLKSRHRDSLIGYETDGNYINKITMEVGTIVQVNNLFKKIPSKIQFLQSFKKDIFKIIEIIENYSLYYENINFYFNYDNKVYNILEKERIVKIIGKGNQLRNITFDNKDYKINIWLVKNVSISKPRRITMINGRIVKDDKINNLINNFYENMIGTKENSYNSYYYNCNCNPSFIDINITHNKTRIKFINEDIYTITKELLDLPKVINKPTDNLYINEQEEYKHYEEEDIIEHTESHIHKYFNFGEVIGQILNKYIITQNNNIVYIIDQHAAHERIIMEKYKKHDYYIEELLDPIYIEGVFNKPSLKLLFDVVDYKEGILIKGIPNFLRKIDLKQIISSIKNEKDLLLEFFREYGCNNSITAGCRLTKEEMFCIIKDLENLENGDICNHGRKTYWKIEEKYLDKIFFR